MLSTGEGFLLFVSTVEAALGILSNGFIALVNCIGCFRRKKFSNISFLLIGLAISRIWVTLSLILNGYMHAFALHKLTSGNMIEYITYLWIVINHLSIWFATSLNIFYFLKIANFSHHIFLWMKRRITVVFIFLIGCLLISWLLSFPQMVKIINDSKRQYGNTSWQIRLRKKESLIKQISPNLGVLFLFLVALITCFLLIISLWRHNRQMRSKDSGFRDLHTEAHVKAMKVLTAFIIFFLLYFAGVAIQVVGFTMPENKLFSIIGLTVSLIYPCGHSFVLILGNSQLKQASVWVLLQVKCFGKERNSRAA